MVQNSPRDHHYIPQFYLRNFSRDLDKKKLYTVMKHGNRAVWAQRAIKSIGFERDLYVHLVGGVPVSVETTINSNVETPISKSDTWAKIAAGRADELDITDKPILYALIRHLEARTPHYLKTVFNLAQLSVDPNSPLAFSDGERRMYAEILRDPDAAKEVFNLMSASLQWTERHYRKAVISVLRSPIPLRTSTKPVNAIPAPPHPALYLPHPGQTPFQLALALSKTTFATLVFGDFDDTFSNVACDIDVALGFNRHVLAQFAHFDVTHLITDREGLTDDMMWAHFDLVKETEQKITYHRTL